MIFSANDMEAIRTFIRDTAVENGASDADPDDRFWRLSDGSWLPASVISWVFSHG